MKNFFYLISLCSLINSCNLELKSNEPVISFKTESQGRKINLSHVLSENFSIVRDSSIIEYEVFFDKKHRRNLILKEEKDTVFYGTVTKRKGFYLLSRLSSDSNYIKHAIQISDTSIIGLETEILQSYLIKSELKTNQEFEEILIDTNDGKNCIQTNKKTNTTLFQNIVKSLPLELFHKQPDLIDSLENKNLTKVLDNELKINVFPSPFSNKISIKTNQKSTYSIRLLTQLNEEVLFNDFNGNVFEIMTSQYKPGLYYMFIKNNTTGKSQKFRLLKE